MKVQFGRTFVSAGIQDGVVVLSPIGGKALGLLRTPDYVSLNLNLGIPNRWTGKYGGLSATIDLDRDGDVFYSLYGVQYGKSRTVFSGSLMVNWLDQTAIPSRTHLSNFLSSSGFNVSAGDWAGVSESYTPGSGLATGIGIMTPQFGGSYNYSLYAGNVGFGW
jgi:hypothetical protein